jgi:8-oxo-dGTP diphosphatase
VSEPVRAAGGVVFRTAFRAVEVLLVYRARYGDWSFPKGRADRGETDEACAVREVEEETGLRCVPGDELPAAEYRDRQGRPKVVRYWTMHIRDGVAGPHNEIDAVRWVTLDEAAALLSHDRDRVTLGAFARLRPGAAHPTVS